MENYNVHTFMDFILVCIIDITYRWTQYTPEAWRLKRTSLLNTFNKLKAQNV